MSSGGGRRHAGTALSIGAASIALTLSSIPPAPIGHALAVHSPAVQAPAGPAPVDAAWGEPGQVGAASLRTPDDSLDHAFDRAGRRLVAALVEAADREARVADREARDTETHVAGALDRSAMLALAATGYGGHEPVRGWLRARRPVRTARGGAPAATARHCATVAAGWTIALYDHWLQTADHDLIRSAWPAVRDFHEDAVARDRDGDGLPDASCRDIDHAALWIESLRAVADIAGELGEMGVARSASQQFERAWSALERRYYSHERGFYLRMPRPERRAGADAPDGPAARDTGGIAVPILALALSLLETDRVAATLERLITQPIDHDRGSTAFVGTALYTYHRSEAGLEALRADARVAAAPAREGSHGPTAGAAALMLSLFRGLLGLRPDAPRDFLVWVPHLPADWDSLELRDYRVGPSRIDLSIVRDDDGRVGNDRADRRSALTARFRHRGAASIGIRFAPASPAASVPLAVELDGEPVDFDRMRGTDDEHVSVRFRLRDRAVVRIVYGTGPGAPDN